jgi:hypothetical protein
LFYAADGTGASPSIRFFNASTGMYHPGSDALGFVASGSEAMRIDSSGNLLVGKTSSGTQNTADGFELRQSGYLFVTKSSDAVAYFNRRTTDGSIAEFRKDGTTVGSIGAKNGDIFISGTAANSGIRFYDTNPALTACSTDGSDADAALSLGVGSVRFKDLYLSGYARLTNASTGTSATDGSFIGVEGGTTALRIVQQENDAMTFHTSGLANERMRIDSSGHLLIGKTTNDFSTAGIALRAEDVIQVTRSGGQCLDLNRQTSDGNVVAFYKDGSAVGSVSVTGSGTTYNTTSDARLKTDIQPIADATDRLMQMNPVSHKWKADPEADAVVGFIAQEMQEIVPEAVSGDPDGDEMMSMDYGRITPVLVAALQDAHKKIEELESRLAAVEAK